MSGFSVDANATLQCPHGGQVQISSANTKTKAGGAAMALSNDTFMISGCPFLIGTVASPCLQVQWVLTDLRVKVNGTPVLSRSSVGLCVNAASAPQGPVTIVSTQTKVKSQ